MIVKEIMTNDYVTKSNLPFCDYVINPYVGCLHACKYCYASFMKRFTGHTEEWGSFIDVKHCHKPISAKRLTNKAVFLSSVTDPYNPLEKKYGITQCLLEQLADIDCRLYISTKSSLILRDIELLKLQKDVIVDVSLNTLDETFRQDMDRASSVAERLHTLRELYENGIQTVLFISPIFPGITDWRELIHATRDFVSEYWFENLNLRGDYKQRILSYIHEKRPDLDGLYRAIYQHNNTSYWDNMAKEFTAWCTSNSINFVNAFNHSQLVRDKKETGVLKRRT